MRFNSEFWPLQTQIDRMFGDVLASESKPARSREQFNPSVDVAESDESFFLSIDLPGVPREKINIQIADGLLQVTGRRENEWNEAKGLNTYRERTYGEFERVFTIPPSVAVESIEASHQNGVLKLTLPKVLAAKSRQIPIQDGKVFPENKGTEEKKPTAEPTA